MGREVEGGWEKKSMARCGSRGGMQSLPTPLFSVIGANFENTQLTRSNALWGQGATTRANSQMPRASDRTNIVVVNKPEEKLCLSQCSN